MTVSMRDPYRDLHSNRSSYPYALDTAEPLLLKHLRRHRRQPSGFYGYMFVEDASSLLPWGRGFDEGFTTTITPSTPELSDLLCNALPGINGFRSTLSDAIRQHLEWAARQLLLGNAPYEVDYLTESADPTAQPVGFQIGWIFPTESVEQLEVGRRRYVQYVPARVGGTGRKNGLHYRELNERNLTVLRLGWRRRRTLRHAFAVMRAADSQRATPQHIATTPNSYFEPERFRARMAGEILTATRDLGWYGRSMFDEHMLGPYLVWRHLQFQRFKIELRDFILKDLIATLQRAARQLGESVRIDLAGLLTSDDVDQAEADLRTGGRHFSELLALRA